MRTFSCSLCLSNVGAHPWRQIDHLTIASELHIELSRLPVRKSPNRFAGKHQIAGSLRISTGGVVLSTVRDAADQDFQIYVLADACGDRNPHVHSLLTEAVFPHQAYVINTAQLDQLA